VWLQEWIENHRDELRLDDLATASVAVDIPTANDLLIGLAGNLQDIACGATPLQFRLALRDVARWAVIHRSTIAVEKLGELLVAMGDGHDAPVGALIDEMVVFSSVGLQPGQVRATWEFHELIPMVVKICRAFGTRFTRDQVARLVVRDESFSRAAFYGLGVLYDVAGPHMRTLALPDTFDRLGQRFLAFYCRLRERHLGTSSWDLVMSGMELKEEGGKIQREDGFLNTWANRGDSAFFDFWQPE
jgi:hypothetical protein